MGINRIRLANGTQNMKSLQDARMQNTYQQNIADNQAQEIRNQGVLQAARNRLQNIPQKLFPEGNFQQIRTNAPNQATYNIDATADLVRNNPFGVIGEVAAPALTAAASIPYDVIQGIGRAVDQSGVDTSPYGSIVDDTEIPEGPSLLDLGQAIDAENPLSSALERTIGAATPLAERISGQDYSPNYLEATTPTPDVAGPSQAGVVPGFTKLKNPDGAPGNYNEFMYKGPDGQIYGSQTYSSIAAGQYPNIYDPNKEMMPTPEGTMGPISLDDFEPQNRMGGELAKLASGGRVGFQEGTDPKLTARQVAEQNPELDAMRQKFFGTNYLDDIDQGNTGTVQYYTGLGDPTSLNYTPPVVETPAVDTSTPVVDGGGDGGGGVTGISTGNETGNTAEQQRLIDEGIGLQIEPGSPVFAPGEEPVTQGDIDAFNQIPVNREYGDPMNIGYGEGQVDPSLAAAVGGVDTTPIDLTGNIQVEDSSKPFADQVGITGQKVSYPGDQSGTIKGVTNIQGLPEVRTITDGQDNIYDAATGELLGNKYEYQGDFEPDEGTVFDDSSELGYQINQKFNSIKDAGAAGVDKLKDSLTALGGKVKEGFDNVIEIGGKSIDIGKSLASGILSLATGIPGIGFALNALGELKTDPADTLNRNIVDELKSENDYGYNMSSGTLNQDPFGRNPVSAFGDYEQTLLDDIDSGSNTKMGLAKTEFAQDYFEKKSAATAPQEDVGAISGDYGAALDDTSSAADISQDLASQQATANVGGGNVMDEFGSGGDTQATTGATVSTSNPDYGQFGRAQNNQSSGGGNQSGGKIVCTMMNNSYGFGSFRNKIWMKFHKDIAPEYQKGYHKIFLPLVKLSKTNKIVKKVLEHIAVHSTIDMRQATRGKTHLLGRVYRKILLPICYLVGKYAK